MDKVSKKVDAAKTALNPEPILRHDSDIKITF